MTLTYDDLPERLRSTINAWLSADTPGPVTEDIGLLVEMLLPVIATEMDAMTAVARRFRHGWFVAMDGESWKHFNGSRLVQITEAERHALDALEVHDGE